MYDETDLYEAIEEALRMYGLDPLSERDSIVYRTLCAGIFRMVSEAKEDAIGMARALTRGES